MKKNVALLFSLALALSACGGGAITPAAISQPEVESAPILPPTVAASPPLLAATSTLEIPSPTQAIQAVVVPTSTPLPQAAPSEAIQFAPGGTWKDVQGSVPAGGSKTYSLSAIQGQVMSVSIRGGYFPLRIQGRDGTLLCPTSAEEECSFWRGILPLTQEYYVTVLSGGAETNFVLRAAINPPGKSEQFFAYEAANASLKYSDDFAPADSLSVLNNKTQPQLTLRLIDTNFYANTNLGEAYFVFGSAADPMTVSTCAQPYEGGGAPEVFLGETDVNGYRFAYFQASGVGAGNLYEQHIYRAALQGACYEAIYFIHSSNIANYAPGVAREFDRAALINRFNAILASFQAQ